MGYYASAVIVFGLVIAFLVRAARAQTSRKQQQIEKRKPSRYESSLKSRSMKSTSTTERNTHTRLVIYQSSNHTVISHPRFQRSNRLSFSSIRFIRFTRIYKRIGSRNTKQNGVVVPFRGGDAIDQTNGHVHP